jgi:leucyl aminopeptidase
MSERLDVVFAPLFTPVAGAVAYLAGEDLTMGASGKDAAKKAGGLFERAAQAARFTGKAKTAIELLAPQGLTANRVLLIGVGGDKDHEADGWVTLGGYAFGQLSGRKSDAATLVVDVAASSARKAAETAADMACGALLRSYKFAKYQTKRPQKNGEGEAPAPDGLTRLTVLCADPEAASQAFVRRRAIANGVFIARDLVNEPANILGPVEFADRARELSRLGVDVEVLEPEALEKLGMRALLGVAQGSARPARVVVMQWHGAKGKKSKPVCIIGKGVVFDTGGISMKPAAGMEDMKGDMGGAACVVGLMHALAERKAQVNAVGLIGLVENMPSGTAQRPGDIVTSMSGQTIEVLNTDAEGRLVLADVLWYAEDRFKPKLIVDLATLTGAIMVALGKENAGLFANDDKLADDLITAGKATGEHVWRMPLAKAYDKLIDSKTADMKNIGGRFGGAITAAQFLQRFVRDVPWAHLDVAGVAMDSNRTEISQSWASGWGVRLLDHMIAERHEKSEK